MNASGINWGSTLERIKTRKKGEEKINEKLRENTESAVASRWSAMREKLQTTFRSRNIQLRFKCNHGGKGTKKNIVPRIMQSAVLNYSRKMRVVGHETLWKVDLSRFSDDALVRYKNEIKDWKVDSRSNCIDNEKRLWPTAINRFYSLRERRSVCSSVSHDFRPRRKNALHGPRPREPRVREYAYRNEERENETFLRRSIQRARKWNTRVHFVDQN